MTRLTVVLGMVLLMTTSGSGPRIRHVPRVVDTQFATRSSLCPDAPVSGGTSEGNDARRSVAEFLGPELVELHVYQVGGGFPDFGAVAAHLRWVLAQRPRSVSRYSPWAEGTPLAAAGILGTLRYTRGRGGRVEVVGVHVCLQDSAGTTWWMRLAPIDVWP